MILYNVVLEQVKHIVVSFYNISFIGSSYVASVRYEYEVRIFCRHSASFSILERNIANPLQAGTRVSVGESRASPAL